VLRRRDTINTAARIPPKYRAEQSRLDKVDRCLLNAPDGPYTPARCVERVQAARQASPDEPATAGGQRRRASAVRGGVPPLRRRRPGIGVAVVWWAHGLDARQSTIHRATLAYGSAYVIVTAGVDDLGERMPVIRGVSPRGR